MDFCDGRYWIGGGGGGGGGSEGVTVLALTLDTVTPGDGRYTGAGGEPPRLLDILAGLCAGRGGRFSSLASSSLSGSWL